MISVVTDVFQWAGAILGMLGAALVAAPRAQLRRDGFAVWLGSNGCLITWAILTQSWGIAVMQVFFLAMSYRGWKNNRQNANAVITAGTITGGPHNLHAGDAVNIDGTFKGNTDGEYCVLAVPSATTFTFRQYRWYERIWRWLRYAK